MKVRPPVEKTCGKYKIIKRKGEIMATYENPKHKQHRG